MRSVFRVRAYPDRVEAWFMDEGVAFENPPAGTPDVVAELAEVPEGGYGSALAPAAVDTLEYSRTAGGRNEWQVIKQLECRSA